MANNDPAPPSKKPAAKKRAARKQQASAPAEPSPDAIPGIPGDIDRESAVRLEQSFEGLDFDDALIDAFSQNSTSYDGHEKKELWNSMAAASAWRIDRACRLLLDPVYFVSKDTAQFEEALCTIAKEGIADGALPAKELGGKQYVHPKAFIEWADAQGLTEWLPPGVRQAVDEMADEAKSEGMPTSLPSGCEKPLTDLQRLIYEAIPIWSDAKPEKAILNRLSEEREVEHGSFQRAVQELKRRGLVDNQRGAGYYRLK